MLMTAIADAFATGLTGSDIDTQSRSLLFKLCPPEIRQQIFDFALTEQYASTMDWPMWDSTDDIGKTVWWVRPDYIGRKVITIALLLTCKRIYFEAHRFLAINKTHIFWHGDHRGPKGLKFHDEKSYFVRFTPAQLSNMTEIRLSVQSTSLAAHLHVVCQLEILQGIRKVHLTLRRADWSHWESNAKMVLNPSGSGGVDPFVQHEWSQQVAQQNDESEDAEWLENAWGSAFKHMRNLKELKLELEVTEDREIELREIVQRAQRWKFPMFEGDALVCQARSDGKMVEVSTWHGPYCNWNSVCSVCNRWRWAQLPPAGGNLSSNLDECHQPLEKQPNRRGPKLVIMNLVYRLAERPVMRTRDWWEV